VSAPSRPADGSRRRVPARLARYASASVISTATTLSILGVLVYGHLLSAGWANVVATGAGTIPSFELNRRWVWAKAGRRSVLKEIVPFCSLSGFGLVASTLVVSAVAGWARAAGLGRGPETILSQVANLGTFGVLWAVQYFLLDRVLFAGHGRPRPTTNPGSTPDEVKPAAIDRHAGRAA
jgi:putative flippase GtrA